MSEIKRYSYCDNCKHKNVCQYRDYAEEVYNKMTGHLNNICASDIFKFTFECTEYDDIGTISKEKGWLV